MTSIEQEKLPVMLSIRGEQYFDGIDPDATELMTEGTMTLTENGMVLAYEETALTGMEGTTTSFQIQGPQVILTRSGTVNSQMVFEEGVSHDSLYETDFGALMITVTATRVYYDIVPDGGTIDLVYEINIENTEAGIIDYHLDIRAKE